MPIGLHAGAKHGTERAHLRDAPCSPWLPRGTIDRPARQDVRRAGSLPTRAGGLPNTGQDLDRAPRRLDVAAPAVARARPRDDVSVLPIKRRARAGAR